MKLWSTMVGIAFIVCPWCLAGHLSDMEEYGSMVSYGSILEWHVTYQERQDCLSDCVRYFVTVYNKKDNFWFGFYVLYCLIQSHTIACTWQFEFHFANLGISNYSHTQPKTITILADRSPIWKETTKNRLFWSTKQGGRLLTLICAIFKDTL